MFVTVFGLTASCVDTTDPPPRPFDAVVYTGKAFELYGVRSKSRAVVQCKIQVEAFSVAPNGRFIVISSRASKAGMGHLYELDITSGNLHQLTSKPIYFKSLEPGERELYSDPEVSPDSRSIAFAVHTVAENDSDDLIGLAGPLAVMDLHSGRSRILKATENVSSNGAAFANSPAWSPDGRKILVAFEVGGAIVDVESGGLHDIDGLMAKPFSEGVVSPVGWLSTADVFLVWNPEQVSGIGKLFVLNLRDGKLRGASDALHVSEALLNDVRSVDVSSEYVLVAHESTAELLGSSGQLLHQWPTRRVRLRRPR